MEEKKQSPGRYEIKYTEQEQNYEPRAKRRALAENAPQGSHRVTRPGAEAPQDPGVAVRRWGRPRRGEGNAEGWAGHSEKPGRGGLCAKQRFRCLGQTHLGAEAETPHGRTTQHLLGNNA